MKILEYLLGNFSKKPKQDLSIGYFGILKNDFDERMKKIDNHQNFMMNRINNYQNFMMDKSMELSKKMNEVLDSLLNTYYELVGYRREAVVLKTNTGYSVRFS